MDEYNEHTTLTRRELCMTENVTLNGSPAAIAGWGDEHATVFIPGTDLGAVFTWGKVARVVADNDGHFFGPAIEIPNSHLNQPPDKSTVTLVTEVNTDPVYGNPHADPTFAHVYTSTDDAFVQYNAEPNEDGSVITVRRTVWSRHRNAKGRHILWQDTAMVLQRDEMPDHIRDLVVSIVV
jgi:hypothetical protein